MPRKEGQKRKLLVLLQILARETDERHPLSVPQIVEKLKEKGIEAERKSVYDDLNTLNEMPDFPYEIMQKRGRGGGYYMTDAPFELAELKLLVDAVYASKFITARKSKVLIDKLGQFTSCYRQEELNRKVLVSGRLKSTDEKILYTVDALHAAITAGEQVQFKYCDWNLQKKMTPRHDGQLYRVSPWVLVWENANYYLIAYTEGRLKHYRVDKMTGITVTDKPLEGTEQYSAFDIAVYGQKHFGMYSGEEMTVTLRGTRAMVGVVLDRFGQDVILVPDGPEHFTVSIPLVLSPQFFGWLFALEPELTLVAPPQAVDQYRERLRLVQAQYRQDQ